METSLSISTAAAMEELTKGREIASKLRVLVQKASEAYGLIEGVMSSFSRAIDILGSVESATMANDLVVRDEVGSESCGMKRKNGAVGRGGFRKRKQASQMRTVISKTFTDDYSWRKYGQKNIHSSKFPRSYFRCTHKYDQGCQAVKHVQISENDPSHFLITYIGEHTCKNPNTVQTIILHSNSIEPSIISFGSYTSNITRESPIPSSLLFSKSQENDDEVISNINLTPGTSSSEYFELPYFDEISAANSSRISLDMSSSVDLLKFVDTMFSFDQFGDVQLS